MTKSPKKTTKQPPLPKNSAAVLLLGTIADTTWRMFVPTIGLTVVGVLLDRNLKTSPWFTAIGVISGAALALGLVLRQLGKVKKNG